MRAWLWGAALAALAVGLGFVPLFDLLGYDFAFAVGLLGAFAAADVGHGVVVEARRLRASRADAEPGGAPAPPALPRPTALGARAAGRSLLLLLAPLGLSLLNALRVPNCNLTAGFAFYALLPVATALYAGPAGALCGLAFPRRGRLLALGLPLGSLLWTGLRLYRDPAVFAFDPFGGYFPGPIYDEALRPTERLLAFRLVNLVWIAAAVAIAEARRPETLRSGSRRAIRVTAALLGVAGLALFAQRGPLGFAVTRNDLRRVLDGERRSEHFVLRYAVAAGRTTAELDLDVADLEFRYGQLRRTFGVEPSGPITVWQFPSPVEKKAWVGAANTLYARPWTREIFVQSDRFPSGKLRHELGHVFAAAFGDPWFGVSLRLLPPRLASGLIEGVAEAGDYGDPDGEWTVHEEAAALVADGRAAPLGQVVGAGFSTLSGPRAYVLAGSFCRFLLDTHGAERLRAVYRSAGDFEGVYGRPLGALEAEWKAFLAGRAPPARGRAAAKERFRRPAIFKKVCAREQAARIAQAHGLLHSDPARAATLLEESCRADPDEPTLTLDLAEARAGLGDRDGAARLAGSVESSRGATEPVRARAAELLASLAFWRGDVETALAATARAGALAPDEGGRRMAVARRRALAEGAGESPSDPLARALFGEPPPAESNPVLTMHLLATWMAAHPDDALGPYLVGRQLLVRAPADALPLLGKACGAPAERVGRALPEGFERECLRMLGEAAFRAGAFTESRRAFGALVQAATTEAERLRARDFLERIDATPSPPPLTPP